METIFVVSEDEFIRARKMEEKLLALPKDAGILFVGVSVKEDKKKSPAYYDLKTETFERAVIYHVYLGVHRDLTEELYTHLVATILATEIAEGNLNVHVEAHRGVARRSF